VIKGFKNSPCPVQGQELIAHALSLSIAPCQLVYLEGKMLNSLSHTRGEEPYRPVFHYML
jgi:hypothetical protein